MITAWKTVHTRRSALPDPEPEDVPAATFFEIVTFSLQDLSVFQNIPCFAQAICTHGL